MKIMKNIVACIILELNSRLWKQLGISKYYSTKVLVKECVPIQFSTYAMLAWRQSVKTPCDKNTTSSYKDT